jgi:hypothetical protein
VAFSFRFLRPCFCCFYARAGPSRLFSYVVVTVRSTKNDSFECDGGLYCACDDCGLGSDWDYGHVLAN